jgi:hypothetical protein
MQISQLQKLHQERFKQLPCHLESCLTVVHCSADKLYGYALPNIGYIYTELTIGCSLPTVGPGQHLMTYLQRRR